MVPEKLAHEFDGSRCLVTGGAGFIGSNLTRTLLSAGARVTVVDSFATGSWENLPSAEALTVIDGDLCTLATLPDLAENADYVFHLAAQVGNLKSIEETQSDARSNILGTVRLLEGCRGAAVRKIVYSSSSAIFGEARQAAIDEDHPQAPASFYALSKSTGENYASLAAELWHLPAVSLRYFNVFGLPMENNEYTGVISIFFHRLIAGEPLVIYGDGGQSRDFIYVADVVQANLLAAAHARPGRIFNVGSGQATTIVELAKTMIEITGRNSEVVFESFRTGEVRHSLADIQRARDELGFAPAYGLHRGLSEMWRRIQPSGDTPETAASTREVLEIDG